MSTTEQVSRPRPRVPVWRYVPFVACVGLLGVFIASGNVAAQIGGVCGLAGLTVGTLAAASSYRDEISDDAARAPLRAAVLGIIPGLTRFWLATTVVFGAEGVWLADGHRGGPVFAALGSIAFVAAFVPMAVRAGREEGVGREVFLQSAAIAFFVTVLASFSYALFEVLAGAPTISMWFVWGVGMFSWAVATAVLNKRMA